MIVLIRNNADWELIYHRKQIKSNYYNAHINLNRVDHNYKWGEKFILKNETDYKYKNSYKGPYETDIFLPMAWSHYK